MTHYEPTMTHYDPLWATIKPIWSTKSYCKPQQTTPRPLDYTASYCEPLQVTVSQVYSTASLLQYPASHFESLRVTLNQLQSITSHCGPFQAIVNHCELLRACCSQLRVNSFQSDPLCATVSQFPSIMSYSDAKNIKINPDMTWHIRSYYIYVDMHITASFVGFTLVTHRESLE